MLCSRCQKRPAVVFVSTGNDSSDTKGYCLSCAKELNIKQVTDIMNQMGISEEDFDAMQEQMDELMSADTDMANLSDDSTDPDDESDDGYTTGGAPTFPPFFKNLFSMSKPEDELSKKGDKSSVDGKKSDGKKKKKARLQEIKEQGISLKADYERQKGKLAKVQETYHEKEGLYENLQERVGEFDEMNSEEIERLKNKQGVELAMEQLTRLAAQMQSRTSDLMNTEVSAIMDAITDGKYNKLWVDENLHVQLMSNGKKISMDQVSRGTLEQIYFAIRMAATKILHEEECPVILDDAFGYYDDRRLAQTLRWLKDSKRQIIIFSCQKREMEMLEKMGCVYHKVML